MQKYEFPYVPSINYENTYSNVISNEVSGDSDQSDSTNDAIVELAGSACANCDDEQLILFTPTGDVAEFVFQIYDTLIASNKPIETNLTGNGAYIVDYIIDRVGCFQADFLTAIRVINNNSYNSNDETTDSTNNVDDSELLLILQTWSNPLFICTFNAGVEGDFFKPYS